MRELKFRAWDIIRNEWCTDWSLSEYTKILNLSKAQYWSDTIIIEQSTGLYDHLGNEVYEGDIVGPIEKSPLVKSPRLIKWLDGSFTYTCPPGYVIKFREGVSKLTKIIENIHENPGLLK